MEPIKDKNGELESALAALLVVVVSTVLLYLTLVPWYVATGAWVLALFITLPNRMDHTGETLVTLWKEIRSKDSTSVKSELGDGEECEHAE